MTPSDTLRLERRSHRIRPRAAPGLMLLILVAALALGLACIGDPGPVDENTPDRCMDEVDNDDDGFTDCDDQDCDVFTFCKGGGVCGDGLVDPGEECDEGASNGMGTCTTDCMLISPGDCGNGVIDAGEQCDQGPMNSDSEPDRCRKDCSNPSCGDGVNDSADECDDGVNNSNTIPDACRTDCMAAFCGDAVVDTGEGCDNGELNSDTAPDACRTNCEPPSCGDGVIDILTGEGCDDGPNNGMPGYCNLTCTPPGCGDGVFDPATELCDAGDTGTWTCLDFNFEGGTLGCNPDCSLDVSTCNNCGNAIIDATEDCDGAALGGETCMTQTGAPGTLACAPDCSFDLSGCMACGNGVVDPGEECDTLNLGGEDCTTVPGGFAGGMLACDASCNFDTTGCMTGMCDPTVPPTYNSSPTVFYQCAFDFSGNPAVDLNISQWILIDIGGGNINVSAVASHFGSMSGTLSPFDCTGNIDVRTAIDGECCEVYTLSGTFTGPNTWTGTFGAEFWETNNPLGECPNAGALGFGCLGSGCSNQVVAVTGTRP